jgi:hypothetical protein
VRESVKDDVPSCSRAGNFVSASSHASSVSRNGPNFGRGWLERRYSNRSPSERSARLTVLRDSSNGNHHVYP